MHARFLVRTHYGRAAIPCRSFSTYASARRFKRSLHRASVRLILTGREWFLLYVLGIVATTAALTLTIGA